MSKRSQKVKLDASLLPSPTGYPEIKPTLCIGLDIAWFGGSKGRPDTQHDCLVSAVCDPLAEAAALHTNPIKLKERDQEAEQIFGEIKRVIEDRGSGLNVVLAIDAPLQGVRAIPDGRKKVLRFCEDRLNVGRQAIDRVMGGSRRWNPTIQPGMPLARRVQMLVAKLEGELQMKCWSPRFADHPKLIIECFPSEAIWAAKRLGGYSTHSTGNTVRAYKRQQGVLLSRRKIEALVADVLLNSFEQLTGMPEHWPMMVKTLISQMLEREDWEKDGCFRGGKLLDDVVDSAICLATALSYANSKTHVWHDSENSNDGHIIGPGLMQELLTGKTRLL
jgi:hypothetical protein